MIVALTGSNGFLLRSELSKLTGEFVKEYDDMALEKLDGEDVEFDRIRESLESLPFLASKKMVILHTPSANKEFLEKFEQLMDNIPETTDAIIVEPKLDKRLSYYKYLKKKTQFKEFNELDESGLSNWLVELVKEKGGKLNNSDARYLVDRVGANQQLLASEIKKLIQYNPEVTRQTIELLTEPTPQSTIFELLDAAFSGNTKRAVKIYEEQRELKVEPIQIIAMLAWQIHVIAIIKTAGDRDIDSIAREAKLNPFVVRKSQNIARRLSLSDLKKLVSEVLDIDVRMKSQSINADDAMLNLLISISQK